VKREIIAIVEGEHIAESKPTEATSRHFCASAGLNGLELQQQLAERTDMPIVFITGHGTCR